MDEPEGKSPDDSLDLDKPEGGTMPVLDHLEELRLTLFKSLGAFVVCSLIVSWFIFKGDFTQIVYWPLDQAQQLLGREPTRDFLTTRGPFSVFSYLYKAIFLGGFAMALPFILYFFVGFVSPGLSHKEKRILLPAGASLLMLFFLGVGFGYGVLAPASLSVSLKLNAIQGFTTLWEPGSYVGLLIWMTLGLGVLFQFPLVLVTLQYLDVITAEKLAEWRRHAVVLILIIAAFATPGGDPFTLFLMAIPLYLLYEGSVVVGSRLSKNKSD